MSILSQEFVFCALDSQEEYPVDFDDVWAAIGYTRKDNAKRSLLSSGYAVGQDFQILLKNEENSKHRVSERHCNQQAKCAVDAGNRTRQTNRTA